MKHIKVKRWFVMGADGDMVDGPYKAHRSAKAAMEEQPGYLKTPEWYHLEPQTYRIPAGNVGGMRAPGRGFSGWMQERDRNLFGERG
jgi:hypothetical protein